jgi:hypothetical protein
MKFGVHGKPDYAINSIPLKVHVSIGYHKVFRCCNNLSVKIAESITASANLPADSLGGLYRILCKTVIFHWSCSAYG